MTKYSKAVCKGVASLTILVFFFAISTFMVLSLVDYSAPHLSTVGGIQNTSLVFGTGTYWVVNLSIPFVLFVVFLITTILEYMSLEGHPSKYAKEIAVYLWPEYKADVWSFHILVAAYLITLLGLYVGYQTDFGYNTDVTMNPLGGASDEMTDRFQSDTLFSIIFDIILFVSCFDCIYAYVFGTYDDLEHVEELESSIIQRHPRAELIDVPYKY
jgi:hypothetical protein